MSVPEVQTKVKLPRREIDACQKELSVQDCIFSFPKCFAVREFMEHVPPVGRPTVAYPIFSDKSTAPQVIDDRPGGQRVVIACEAGVGRTEVKGEVRKRGVVADVFESRGVAVQPICETVKSGLYFWIPDKMCSVYPG